MANPPSWSNVLALCQGEGANGSTTFQDDSSYALSLSRRGSTETMSTLQAKYGTSSIRIPSGGTQGLNTAELTNKGATVTFETWVRLDDLTLGTDFNGKAITLWESSGTPMVYVDAASTTEISAYPGQGGVTCVTSGAGLTQNVWTHIAVVFKPNSTKVYVGGVLKGSAATSSLGATYAGAGTGMLCGAAWVSNSPTTASYYDLLRLSAEEVYTANFTPPLGPLPETVAATGTASGHGVGTGKGTAVKKATGAGAGIAAAAGAGKATASAPGTASGTGTATDPSATSKVSAAGAAPAIGSAADTSASSTAAAVASAFGVADANSGGFTGAVGAAAGAGSASATSIAGGVAYSAGIGAASGDALVLTLAAGAAAGIAGGVADGRQVVIGVGFAIGIGSASAPWKLASVYPTSLRPVKFGIPIGPATPSHPKQARGMNVVRFGYPVLYHQREP